MGAAVEIVNYHTGDVVHTVHISEGRNPDRVESGIQINLSPEFYTRVVQDAE